MKGLAKTGGTTKQSLAVARLFALLTTAISVLLPSVFLGERAAAETKLTLSTLAQPNSEGEKAARLFAERVAEATNGRIEITVFPGSRLGDWVEVHEQVMRGSVDFALQPLSTMFEQRLAINWFPYAVHDYASAREAFMKGGYIFEIVDAILKGGSVKILGPYAVGMGGAGFTKAVPEPRNPDAQRGMRVRVWPGGKTHVALMERFDFSVATLPWAEIPGALGTGLVDGVIGGTPQLAAENFKDALNMWVQYNDHFEIWWFIANPVLFSSLSVADQEALVAIANDIARQSFDAVEKVDLDNIDKLREAGVDVVLLSDDELAEFARVARNDVWPKIAGEVGPEVMKQLKARFGLNW